MKNKKKHSIILVYKYAMGIFSFHNAIILSIFQFIPCIIDEKKFRKKGISGFLPIIKNNKFYLGLNKKMYLVKKWVKVMDLVNLLLHVVVLEWGPNTIPCKSKITKSMTLTTRSQEVWTESIQGLRRYNHFDTKHNPIKDWMNSPILYIGTVHFQF